MIYTTRHVQEIHVQQWKLDEYRKDPAKLQSLAIRCHKHDLKNRHGAITQLAIRLIDEKEVVQTYQGGSQEILMELKFDCSYSYLEYTGSREGIVTIHRRLLSKEALAISQEIIWKEFDQGYAFIGTFLPEAVRRVGCNCCYGGGPDLTATSNYLDNGDLEILFTVDFDFDEEADDHE